MRTPLFAVLGSSLLLTASFAVAQQDCASVGKSRGAAAEEKCLRDERERELREQITVQKEELDLRRERIADYYEQLRDDIDYQWTGIDLALQRRISDERFRMQDLRRNTTENSEELERRNGYLVDLENERRFLSTAKDRYKRILTDRERLELSSMEYQLVEWEMRIRGFRSFSESVYFSR